MGLRSSEEESYLLRVAAAAGQSLGFTFAIVLDTNKRPHLQSPPRRSCSHALSLSLSLSLSLFPQSIAQLICTAPAKLVDVKRYALLGYPPGWWPCPATA